MRAWISTLALDIILTATVWSLSSPFLTVAEQVWPKCPLPISFPNSYLAPKFLLYPKLLSSDCCCCCCCSASTPPCSGIGPSFGFPPPPSLLTNDAAICFAGDGGGNGLLKNLLGVDALAGDGDTPPGSGLAATPCGYVLGQGLGCVEEDLAGVFFTESTPLREVEEGNDVGWLWSVEEATIVTVVASFSLAGLVLP